MEPMAAAIDQERFVAFVDGITEALSKTNFREIVLNLLSDLFGFDDSAFFLLDRRKLTPAFPVYRNMATSIVDGYWSDFPRIDVFWEAIRKGDPFASKVVGLTDVVRPDVYEQSDLYRKVMEPAGYWDFCALPLDTGRDVGGIICVAKPKARGRFEPGERRTLEVLNGAIARALGTFLAMNELRSARQFHETAMNELREGVILLGADNAVEACNVAAGAICAEMFPDDPARAMSKLVGSLAGRIAGTASGRSAAIELAGERFGIRIVPVVLPSPLYNLEHKSIVYLTRTAATGDAYERLAATYQLSERELEVVKLVAEGRDNAEVARLLFLSQHTVKTHLQNVFRKLGIGSRNGIVRVVRSMERDAGDPT